MDGVARLSLLCLLSSIEDGTIFRQFRKDGPIGEARAPASVLHIVRAQEKLAGLLEVFSAHSLRSGFVTKAAVQKVPRLTQWS